MSSKITQAGAGTGKTTSLVNEVYDFYIKFRTEQNRDPRIVLTTFTRKATQELKERILQKAININEDNDFLNFVLSRGNLHISTIHGVVSLFLRRYGSDLGYYPNFRVVNKAKTLATGILRDLLKNHNELLENYSFENLLDYSIKFYEVHLENPNIIPATKADLEKIINDKSQEEEMDPEINSGILENIESVGKQFEKIGFLFSKRFYEEKKNLGIMTIADLELFALKCIREKPNLIKDFSNCWDYWLVDEFQDTSPTQDRILDHFVKRSVYYYVGDPQQSIYSFRGARPRVFDDKKDKVKNIAHLNNNYRSNRALVSFFNDFFSSHKDKKFEPLISKSKRSAPDYPVCKFIICKEEEVLQEDAVCSKVVSLIKNGVQPSEICVLCKTNDQLSRIFQSLKTYKVPSQLHSSEAFHKRQEIKDLKIMIKFILNPHDNLNTLSFLRMPWVTIEEKIILKISKATTKGSSLWKTINGDKIFSDISEKLNEIIFDANTKGVVEAVRKFCIDSDFINQSLYYDETGRRESNIWKFLMSFNEDNLEFNFLDHIEHDEYEYNEDSYSSSTGSDAIPAINPNMINLMTIHKAKGLEFKHVFIAFFDKTTRGKSNNTLALDRKSGKWAIPYDLNGTKKASVLAQKIKDHENQIKDKEIDRQLYVAMTRAVDSLHIFVDHNSITQVKNKTEGYWLKNFDWNFSPGFYNKKDYQYTVEYPEEKQHKIASLQKTKLSIPCKLQSEKLIKRSVGDILSSYKKPDQDQQKKWKMDISANVKRADFGTKFHKFMQIYKTNRSFDIGNLFKSENQVKEVKLALEFLETLQDPPFMKIIKNGNSEWGFMKKINGYVLEGVIDLWSVVDDVAWIIDYKTGTLKTDEYALKQLSIYSLAVKDVCKKDIKIAAIYPMEKHVTIQDGAFIEKTLKEMELN